MQAQATLRYASIAPQKARLVVDQIRGLSADKAIECLRFSSKKAAGLIKKVLDSAIANAEHNDGADIDELKVSSIYVDRGPSMMRTSARAKGRGNRIIKPTCHIFLTVGDTVGNQK